MPGVIVEVWTDLKILLLDESHLSQSNFFEKKDFFNAATNFAIRLKSHEKSQNKRIYNLKVQEKGKHHRGSSKNRCNDLLLFLKRISSEEERLFDTTSHRSKKQQELTHTCLLYEKLESLANITHFKSLSASENRPLMIN